MKTIKWLLLGVLVLAFAYVLSYAFIVTPSGIPEVKGMPPWQRAPRYAVEGDFVKEFYAPALKLDQQLLSKRWEF